MIRRERIPDDVGDFGKVVLVIPDKDHAEPEDAEHVNGEREKELEEEAIVPPTDAVVHPRTVVVECLHTAKRKTASWCSACNHQ